MFKRVDELMADFRFTELMGSKPNYTELGRKYGLDPRTVKKIKETSKKILSWKSL